MRVDLPDISFIVGSCILVTVLRFVTDNELSSIVDVINVTYL